MDISFNSLEIPITLVPLVSKCNILCEMSKIEMYVCAGDVVVGVGLFESCFVIEVYNHYSKNII